MSKIFSHDLCLFVCLLYALGNDKALSEQLQRLRFRMEGEMAADVSSQTLVLQNGVEKTLDSALAQMLGYKTAEKAHEQIMQHSHSHSQQLTRRLIQSSSDSNLIHSQSRSSSTSSPKNTKRKGRRITTGNRKVLPEKPLQLEPRLWSKRTNDLAAEVKTRQAQVQQQRKRRPKHLHAAKMQSLKHGW